MSSHDPQTKAMQWAVLITIGVQTLLGALCLWLGLRGSSHELLIGWGTWFVAIPIGFAAYRRKLRGQSFAVVRLAIVLAMAGLVLLFWAIGVGRLGP